MRRHSPEQVIRRAMRKKWRGRTLSYKVDLIPDELATAAIQALRNEGYFFARKADPECNVCDRTLPEHADDCPERNR